jgi:hypothetical protein
MRNLISRIRTYASGAWADYVAVQEQVAKVRRKGML